MPAIIQNIETTTIAHSQLSIAAEQREISGGTPQDDACILKIRLRGGHAPHERARSARRATAIPMHTSEPIQTRPPE